MNIPKEAIKQTIKGAKSYDDFKYNLHKMGKKAEPSFRVPEDIATDENGDRKFPAFIKGWYRKLRYEMSKDSSFGTPTTAHDRRQTAYYKRLERMGHPEPLRMMGIKW